MRIGYLTYGLDRTPTGIGRYSIQLLHALARLPDAPELVLLMTEREDPQRLIEHYECHRLAGCHLLPALMTAGNLAVSNAIRRYQLDIVHDPNGIAPFLGPRLGTRRIVTIHDAFAYVAPETHNRLDNWRYRWQLPAAARRSDIVITVSECSRRDLVRHLDLRNEQVSVIGEGVDSRFKPVLDNDERRAVLARYGIQGRYLLYLGGINARKNIARLFEAYSRVRSRHPDVRLVIGGKRQWQTDEIEEAFHRLNLAPDVHFTGYLDDYDLPAVYSAAELFVFPSLYEGFGLPPLEAMACGTPVVTSNTSSLPEVTGNAALAVDPYNIEAIAQAIDRLLTDSALRADLRQRGLARASHLTWDQTARHTRDLYEQTSERDGQRVPSRSTT